MFTGINIGDTKKYVSPSDPDKDNPTVFTIGVIDSIVEAYIKDKTSTFVEGGDGSANLCFATSTRDLLTVKFGLRNLENFVDPATKQPVTFATEQVSISNNVYTVVKDAILKVIHPDILSELAREIAKANKISSEETKNY